MESFFKEDVLHDYASSSIWQVIVSTLHNVFLFFLHNVLFSLIKILETSRKNFSRGWHSFEGREALIF